MRLLAMTVFGAQRWFLLRQLREVAVGTRPPYDRWGVIRPVFLRWGTEGFGRRNASPTAGGKIVDAPERCVMGGSSSENPGGNCTTGIPFGSMPACALARNDMVILVAAAVFAAVVT